MAKRFLISKTIRKRKRFPYPIYIVRFIDIFVRFTYNKDTEEHTIHHEGGASYDRNRNRIQD